jgi:hypothetical protein
LARESIDIDLRNSPAYDAQANGAAEQAVGNCKRMIRTLVSVVNANYQVVIGPRHYLYGWATRHASWLINRYRGRGPLKHTAHYATRGFEYKGALVTFGEGVLALWVTGRGAKPQKTWVRGVFVGKHDTDDTFLVATELGVIGVRTIRRLAEDLQWEKEIMTKCTGYPWKLAPDVQRRAAWAARPQPHSLPIAVPATPTPAEPAARTPVAIDVDENPDIGTLTPVAAEAVAVSPQSTSSSSSSSDGRSRSPASPRAAASSTPVPRSSPKRGREDDNGSDEEERLRVGAVVASLSSDVAQDRMKGMNVINALVSPHTSDEFMQPITEEELVNSRADEIKKLQTFEVYQEVPVSAGANQKIITCTWVDRRRGPGVKSRICAREFRRKGDRDNEFFATTPASTSTRVIDLIACSLGLSTMTADVSSAFLHAKIPEGTTVLIQPPEGCVGADGSPCLWRLNKWLYGLRGAPQAWNQHFSSVLCDELKFIRSVAEPNLYVSKDLNVYILVHVDDMHLCGPESAMKRVLNRLSEDLVLKSEGPFRPGDSYSFLGMTREVRAHETILVPDKSYTLETMKQLDLMECRPASTASTNLSELSNDKEELDSEGTTLYRSGVGRLLFLAHSRMDIQYAVRHLATKMKTPTHRDLRQLKHLTRYLAGTMNVGIRFPRSSGQQEIKHIEAFTDASWASADTDERKSVSGGCLFVNGCCLGSYTRGQSLTAMSSAEAEFYSIVLCASECIALKNTLTDIGFAVSVSIATDSSAALAMCRRLGPGQAKHIQTRYYFIQQLCAGKVIEIVKCRGEVNVADICTKPVTNKVHRALWPLTGLVTIDQPASSTAAIKSDGHTSKMLAALTLLLQATRSAAMFSNGDEDTGGSSSHVDLWSWVEGLSMFWFMVGSAVCFWLTMIRSGWMRWRASQTMVSTTSIGIQTDPMIVTPTTTALARDQIHIVRGGYAYHLRHDCHHLKSCRVESRELCKDCLRKWR